MKRASEKISSSFTDRLRTDPNAITPAVQRAATAPHATPSSEPRAMSANTIQGRKPR
jgi:hypothetical protein